MRRQYLIFEADYASDFMLSTLSIKGSIYKKIKSRHCWKWQEQPLHCLSKVCVFFKAKRNSANDNNLVTCITINVLNSWLLTKPNLLTLVRKKCTGFEFWKSYVVCNRNHRWMFSSPHVTSSWWKTFWPLFSYLFPYFLVNLLYCFVVYLGRLSDHFGKT